MKIFCYYSTNITISSCKDDDLHKHFQIYALGYCKGKIHGILTTRSKATVLLWQSDYKYPREVISM